jgi:hypothetical protein
VRRRAEMSGYWGPALVSPAGEVIECGYAMHYSTCRQTVRERGIVCEPYEGEDRTLARLGWVRVGGEGEVTLADYSNAHQLTQAQRDSLFDMLSAAKARADEEGSYIAETYAEFLNRDLSEIE